MRRPLAATASLAAAGLLAACAAAAPHRAAPSLRSPPRPAATTTTSRPAVTTTTPRPSATTTTTRPSATTTRPSATTTTQPAVTTTTQPTPPYPVSERSLPFVDTSRRTVAGGRILAQDRPLTTLVWMPRVSGRWPLVVFASGYDVGPTSVRTLLASWAARGYVVAAPEFPLADPTVFGTVDESDLDNEPADVRFVIRSLLGARDPLRPAIDGRDLAIAGHSDGAEVALVLADERGLPAATRLRAAIVMSGQPVPGLSGRNPPMLVTQGTADRINPLARGYAVYRQAARPKYLLTLLGGGHLPPLQAGSAWLPAVESVTGNFLDAYLGGRSGDLARMQTLGTVPGLTRLRADAVRGPGPRRRLSGG